MWTPSAGAAEEARLRLLEPQRVCAGRPINNGVAECKCLKVGTQRCPIGVTYPTRLLTFFSRFRPQPSTAPEVPEPCRRQLRVAHGVLNILMAEVGSARVSWPLEANAKPQACRSICGCTLNPRLASAPARSTMRAKPAVVKGAPRSEVNTKGDF